MLNNTPRKDDRIFPTSKKTLGANFVQRKKIAIRLNDPRIRKISFHTLHYWKRTMKYGKTKDLLYIQSVLSHKGHQVHDAVYHLENALCRTGSDDEFHLKTTKTMEEASRLVEVGLEFVVEHGYNALRKRK